MLQPEQNQSRPADKPGYQLSIIYVLLLAAAAFLVYSNTIDGEFHSTDPYFKAETEVEVTTAQMSETVMWQDVEKRSPLSYFSFRTTYQLFGADVEVMHLTNIALHFLAAAAFFWFVLALFKLRRNAQPPGKIEYFAAFTAAFLFVLHPLATQAVNFLLYREFLLGGLFLFLALAAYAGIKRENTVGKRVPAQVFYTLLLALSVAAGWFSSPLIIAVVPLVVMIDWFFVHPDKLAVSLIKFAVAAVVAVVLVNFVRQDAAWGETGAAEYLLLQLSTLPEQLRVLLLPVELKVFYVLTPPESFGGMQMLGIGILAALFGLSLLLHRKLPFTALGLAFIAAALAVAAVLPGSLLLGEHRLYIAAAGALLTLIALGYELGGSRSILVLPVIMVVIGGLAAPAAYFRNADWEKGRLLWEDNRQKAEKSSEAWLMVARTLQEYLDYALAITYASRAGALDKSSSEAYTLRGISYKYLEKFERAWDDFDTAVALDSTDLEARLNRGIVSTLMKNYSESIQDLLYVINENYRRPFVLNSLGVAIMEMGNLRKALDYVTLSMQEDPDYFEAVYNAATIYMRMQQYDKAVPLYEKALKLTDNKGTVLFQRAVARHYSGQHELAWVDLQLAMQNGKQVSKEVVDQFKAKLKK